ncbi:uncharacterized, partial [Tachysurus ichikawai]
QHSFLSGPLSFDWKTQCVPGAFLCGSTPAWLSPEEWNKEAGITARCRSLIS